ncbi:hypothetical protein [Dyella flava]|uniref:hypothetical protein n=1 Tax=Dyella flava TaxID=1920170 RepID=UPI001EF7D23C|nr:hypothetical protein [Dyella flava]GLQ51204.1 hypothetical protein GCM10010872_26530 [Dyella flava]
MRHGEIAKATKNEVVSYGGEERIGIEPISAKLRTKSGKRREVPPNAAAVEALASLPHKFVSRHADTISDWFTVDATRATIGGTLIGSGTPCCAPGDGWRATQAYPEIRRPCQLQDHQNVCPSMSDRRDERGPKDQPVEVYTLHKVRISLHFPAYHTSACLFAINSLQTHRDLKRGMLYPTELQGMAGKA